MTIRISNADTSPYLGADRPARQIKLQGSNGRRRYMSAYLVETVCGTAAIRVISGNPNAKHPGDWR